MGDYSPIIPCGHIVEVFGYSQLKYSPLQQLVKGKSERCLPFHNWVGSTSNPLESTLGQGLLQALLNV